MQRLRSEFLSATVAFILQFWQVDHITAVVEGGGMCDLDNLRTLCVPCHQDVTADLLRSRAQQRQLEAAARCGDITAFFKPKT